MSVDDLPAPPLRTDVFDEGGAEAVVATGVEDHELLLLGWLGSQADAGARGAHVALRQARRADAQTLVVHVSRVPALLAALAEVSLRLTQLWERDGSAHWAQRGRPEQGARGPQDPEGREGPPVPRPRRTDAERAQRRREKAALLERVHEHAAEVLAAFVGADDDAQAAERVGAVLGTSPEVSLELVTHLQFRELTQAARRRHREP